MKTLEKIILVGALVFSGCQEYQAMNLEKPQRKEPEIVSVVKEEPKEVPLKVEKPKAVFRVEEKLKDERTPLTIEERLKLDSISRNIETGALAGTIITDKYDVHVKVKDKKGREYDFTRFSLGCSLLRGWQIDRLAVTMRDDSDYYHVFWLKDINRIEKQEKKERIYFKDGRNFTGKWVDNETPIGIYKKDFEDIFATGLFKGFKRKISIKDIESISIDTSKADENFQEEYLKKSSISSPKIVELKDGKKYFTNLGHVIDSCGHNWSSQHHYRLLKYCELKDDGKIAKGVSLSEISEIEFTGETNVEYPQCRGVMVRYKDKREEKGYLFLTSESYGGECNHAHRFKHWDKFILHYDYGASIVPLDKVKKVIIPEQPVKMEKTPLNIEGEKNENN
ncbi:hypothetical protein GOV06_00360 [Candidatus Woesearchaeota archaeon]|nr:hypothetical protein [Candidatus Woesearchaeota archaeon]